MTLSVGANDRVFGSLEIDNLSVRVFVLRERSWECLSVQYRRRVEEFPITSALLLARLPISRLCEEARLLALGSASAEFGMVRRTRVIGRACRTGIKELEDPVEVGMDR